MESRDLNFDRPTDPLAWAVVAIKRPRDLTQQQWIRAYTLIQDHRIRVGGPLPGDEAVIVEANTGPGGRRASG